MMALGFSLGVPRLLAGDPFHVAVDYGIEAKMRDGVVLRADIYRPADEGKYPVLLERTPYDKAGGAPIGLRGAARGYVVIIQDVRGRYSSDGEWYPFKYESQDGYEAVEWAAALPYSNGKIGMFGMSYVGATQWLAAIAHPPHLAGIFPSITASDYHDGWTYQGGAFEQWFSQSWTSYLAQETLNRRVQQNSNPLPRVWNLPLSSYPLVDPGLESVLNTQALAPYFVDWLTHPSYDDYWKQWSIEDHYAQITVPAYNVGAWYDIFLGGTLRNYLGMKAKSPTEFARKEQRLLVRTGGHAGWGATIGQIDFGFQSVINEDDIMLRWYDHLLKGIANGVDREKPVKIFVMGKNIWREEEDWPLARARVAPFYLHSDGKANGLIGHGTLSTESPQAESPDAFTYDPTDPVPTRGGAICCDEHLAAGAWDQRPVEARRDVLVYSTPPFRQDFEVTGPVAVELYASSDTVDTDFTAKLIDVWPNGLAQNLTDGIMRARYRNSQEKPEFMNPGETYKFKLDLWSTSNVFLTGHRLRLEISSSNFPRFDRNLNTGELQSSRTRFAKVTNTLYHDRYHPSALVLSCVPR